jgi:hypothetical protein
MRIPTLGNMVVDWVAATDTTQLRTQQAINGVTGQILPGGLGGVGSGFLAPETSYSHPYRPSHFGHNSIRHNQV